MVKRHELDEFSTTRTEEMNSIISLFSCYQYYIWSQTRHTDLEDEKGKVWG